MGTSGNRGCQWASKNSYSNSIRVGYDRVEQIQEGVSGNFWDDGLPPCVQSQLECLHGWRVHNLFWQLVPVRDYSNAECMSMATGFTQLLVNLESLTSKPNACLLRFAWSIVDPVAHGLTRGLSGNMKFIRESAE